LKRFTIAGVNGAGKTSLYNIAFAKSNLLGMRVNLDELVRPLGDWRNEKLQLEAGKQAVRLVRQYLNDGVSFHQETTLAGRSIFRTIRDAKAVGYEIKMYYVGLDSAEIAKERVHTRVQKGGHGVDETLIEKRFHASLEHLKQAVSLCDTIQLYDNSGESIRYVLTIEHGEVKERETTLPLWLSKIL
jgi:predicted ABC-type ATPase